MKPRVIVMGASAGGVEALRAVVAGLPPDLQAAVLVVLHVPSAGRSVLPAILARSGPLPARHAVTGDRLVAGEILVAPPDHHLLVDDGAAVLTRGPRENGHRPAIDVLFRSAARAKGARTIGVVLSGALDDGTAGLVAVHARRGTTVVQHPHDALYPSMPESALRHVQVDHVAAAPELGPLLAHLAAQPAPVDVVAPSRLMDLEAEVALMNDRVLDGDQHPGQPSGFSCPDCNGVLWEIKDGELVRYRCRVGHAWSAEGLLAQQAEQLDSALWMALRGLEEKAALARSCAERSRADGRPMSAASFEQSAGDATRAAAVIRSLLESRVGSPGADDLAQLADDDGKAAR